MRHKGCRCVVTYCNGKNRQNVWSKEVWKADQETLGQRETVGLEEPKTADDRLKSLPKGKDVTAEYIRNATPGVGQKLKEKEFKTKKQDEEIENADWLFGKFGGNILIRDDQGQVSVNDYIWNGKNWDLKSISSSKYATIDKRIKHGMEQIADNPGGLLINISKSKLNIEEMETMLEQIAKERVKVPSDFIIRKDENYKVIRMKRE